MIEYLPILKQAVMLNANAVYEYCWQYGQLLNFIFSAQDIFAFVPVIFLLVLFPLGLLVFFSLRRAAKKIFQDLAELTEFHFTSTPFNHKVEEVIRAEVGDYRPPWWYLSHLGTLMAFGADLKLSYQVEVLQAEDKNKFHLNYYPHKPPIHELTEKINIVVYFPGLGLTAKSKIAQKFAKQMWKSGYYTVIVDPRGLEVPLSTNRPWHPGFFDDAIQSIHHLTSIYPPSRANLFLTGYSAGTNLVQKVLIHFHSYPRHEINLVGACCVCINYDYLLSRSRLESTIIGCAYSLLICFTLKQLLHQNAHVHDSKHLQTIQSKCYFISHYDSIAGRLIHGYENEEDLRMALSMQQLQRINVPMIALQAVDDPLHSGQVRENICVQEVIRNPHIMYMETKYGNHFGYYEGSIFDMFTNEASYTYPAKVSTSFFQSILKNQSSSSPDTATTAAAAVPAQPLSINTIIA